MNLYFYSTGRVAPATVPDDQHRQLAAEPDYTGIIPPMQLRRMSKAVRTGIAAAKLCLQATGQEQPSAISIGTAFGCLQDTEHFLGKMVDQDEQLLTPTAFIQSTHNTVSGQIALVLGCLGHNLTFVQRGHSFAHAALNASLELGEHPGGTVLLGGIDELTPRAHRVLAAAGVNGDQDRPGPAAGEGAAFFLTGDVPKEGAWKLEALELFLEPDAGLAAAQLGEIIGAMPAADLVLSGANEDAFSSLAYRFSLPPETAVLPFKARTGEFATADAQALSLLLGGAFGEPRRVILVNHYLRDFAVWQLVRC